MNGDDVHEASIKILKSMTLGTGVRALEWGKYSHIVKIYEILEKTSLLPFIFEKHLMHGYDVHEVIYRNC